MKKLYYLIAMALMGLTFTSCEDVPAPFGQPQNPNQQETIDPTGTGTATDPFNVAGVLKYVKDLGADVESTTDVYFTGIVTSVTEAFGTQFGNATFTVADTETSKTIFTFYRGLYLGNKKYDDATAVNVKEGDKVVICGKVVYYKGSTPETAQGKAYVVSINGTGGGDTPTPPSTETIGTKDAPITVAQALEYITPLADNGTTDKEAFVAGTIKQIKTAEDKIAQYKNIDYIITDGTNDITVFRGKNLDNTDFTAAGQINVGDKVVVRGKLTKYVKDSNTTPEIAQGNYLVSLTKGSDGGGDTGGGDAGSNLVTNGGFENWAEGAPVDWNGPAANSPAISESNDAHEGTKSILFEGNSSTNKRLSSKKMKLKAGTYSISLYAKATEGEVKIAPGYVAFKSDGTLDSQNYKYPTDYPVVPTTWTLVTHSFTLEADTEICLVIMKHKSTTASILLDEYSLTTTDGGLVE